MRGWRGKEERQKGRQEEGAPSLEAQNTQGFSDSSLKSEES